uniref:Uncharacterized protein n=1 Tax=Heterorhabditis bacteriophora TaxID=37862 RepID=A0A1I7X9D4_HETBA
MSRHTRNLDKGWLRQVRGTIDQPESNGTPIWTKRAKIDCMRNIDNLNEVSVSFAYLVFPRMEIHDENDRQCGTSELRRNTSENLVKYVITVSRQYERFKLATTDPDDFKCLIFAANLDSPQDADIRIRILQKLKTRKFLITPENGYQMSISVMLKIHRLRVAVKSIINVDSDIPLKNGHIIFSQIDLSPSNIIRRSYEVIYDVSVGILIRRWHTNQLRL